MDLLSRCYEISSNGQELRRLAEEYDRQLTAFEDPLNLEKITKLIFLTFIRTVDKGKRQKVLEVVDALPIKFTQDNYIAGY